MRTPKLSATAQERSKTAKLRLKDLTPKARAAQQVKGGPIVHPGAVIKGRKS